MEGTILPGKVLIKKEELKTKGGIYLPDTVAKERYAGVIVMVGVKLPKFELELNVGDKVIYSKYAEIPTNELVFDQEKYLLINATDIMYIYSKE